MRLDIQMVSSGTYSSAQTYSLMNIYHHSVLSLSSHSLSASTDTSKIVSFLLASHFFKKPRRPSGYEFQEAAPNSSIAIFYSRSKISWVCPFASVFSFGGAPCFAFLRCMLPWAIWSCVCEFWGIRDGLRVCVCTYLWGGMGAVGWPLLNIWLGLHKHYNSIKFKINMPSRSPLFSLLLFLALLYIITNHQVR